MLLSVFLDCKNASLHHHLIQPPPDDLISPQIECGFLRGCITAADREFFPLPARTLVLEAISPVTLSHAPLIQHPWHHL